MEVFLTKGCDCLWLFTQNIINKLPPKRNTQYEKGAVNYVQKFNSINILITISEVNFHSIHRKVVSPGITLRWEKQHALTRRKCLLIIKGALKFLKILLWIDNIKHTYISEWSDCKAKTFCWIFFQQKRFDIRKRYQQRLKVSNLAKVERVCLNIFKAIII